MTKLETLEDIEKEYYKFGEPEEEECDPCMVLSNVRQKALMWAKEDYECIQKSKQHIKEMERLKSLGYPQGIPLIPIACEVRLEFIMEFFNIIEEELKWKR